jgi:hypothetical protein
MAQLIATEPERQPIAILYGTVVSNETDGTCTCYIGGDQEQAISSIRRLRTPVVVGDVVMLSKRGTEVTVIGALSAGYEQVLNFTPQFDQGVTNIGFTVVQCIYYRFGRWCNIQCRGTFTAAGTAGSAILMTGLDGSLAGSGGLPFALNSGSGTVGLFRWAHAGLLYRGITEWHSASAVRFLRGDSTVNGFLGATDPNAGIANTDSFACSISCQVV